MESVAALAVAAIALVTLLQLQLVSMRTADKAEGLTQALLLAQAQIAETIAEGFPSVGVKSGSVQAQGDQFDWQIAVTDSPLPALSAKTPIAPATRPNPTSTRLRQISVEVSWQKGPGIKHLTLTTLAAENINRAG